VLLKKPGEPLKLQGTGMDSGEASGWSIQELKPASGFVAAFAVEGRSLRLRCYQWPDQVA